MDTTRRVLILDDDPGLRSTALPILGKAGVEIDFVATPAALLEKLHGAIYAAVLIDSMSDAYDARELLAAIQPIEPRPVIILTSATGTQDPDDPFLVSLVVRKPYDLQMVTGVLLACGGATPGAMAPPPAC